MSSFNITENITLNYDGTNFIINSVNYSAPLSLQNSTEFDVTVTLNFASAVSSASHYIIVNSSNITFDGANSTINISAAGYSGLIQSIGNNAIIIQNIIVNSSPGSLMNNGGWICRENFENCLAINCIVFGFIPNNSGGILGANCNNCIANNCSSFGTIANNSGGIFGANCNNCVTNSCFSNGDIENNSGGIFGYGSINCTANQCFSSGSILTNSGGIFGSNCNNNALNANCVANGCYSLGIIGNTNSYNSGGIFGVSCNSSATNSTCSALYCFSLGYIYGDNSGGNGGIFGGNGISCTAQNCYSIGLIGTSSGGIFLTSTNGEALYCYSIGSISTLAGGIFSMSCSDCSAISCYTVGNIDSQAGGIFGSQSNNCSAQFCYSLGNANTAAGSIFGSSSTNSTCTSCYVLHGLTSNLFGNGSSNTTIINCIAENGGSWDDVYAQATIANSNSQWISVLSNTPFLLESFNNSNFQNLSPYGYQYTYVIPNNLTITENGIKTYLFLTGYYKQSQQNYSSNIYGYLFANYSITVNLSELNKIPIIFNITKNMKQELNYIFP